MGCGAGRLVWKGTSPAPRAPAVEAAAPVPGSLGELLADDHEQLMRILEAVRRRHGLDFRGYRLGTLVRRVRNRMITIQAASLAAYAGRIEDDPEEAGRLIERLTIKVSRFFRNPGTFDAIHGALLEKCAAPLRAPLAVWSAGCGQGEEAYSLAVLLAEIGLPASRGTVLGTDIDPVALAAAERAAYPATALADVRPALRERYFVPAADGTHAVTPDIRRRVRLALHDLASAGSPPAGGPFDLICCRNVLIYFQPRLQERVMRLLLSSLAPGGLLCLGEAEWLATSLAAGVEVLEPRARLFRVGR